MEREAEREKRGKERTEARTKMRRPTWSCGSMGEKEREEAKKDWRRADQYLKEVEDPLSKDEDIAKAEHLVWVYDEKLRDVRK